MAYITHLTAALVSVGARRAYFTFDIEPGQTKPFRRYALAGDKIIRVDYRPSDWAYGSGQHAHTAFQMMLGEGSGHERLCFATSGETCAQAVLRNHREYAAAEQARADDYLRNCG